jgi:hypothetical protein
MRRQILLSPKGIDRQSKKARRSYHPMPRRIPSPFSRTRCIGAVSKQNHMRPVCPMTARLANGHMLPNLLRGGTRTVWDKRVSQWHGGENYNAASQAQDITSDRTRYSQAAHHLLRRKTISTAKE